MVKQTLAEFNGNPPQCDLIHLILLLLLAGSLQFRNFTFNYRKKAKKKSRKRSNMVQFGRWRDSFNSALYSILL